MKYFTFLIVAIACSIILSACGSQNTGSNRQKEEYQAEIQAQLDELSKQIQELRAEAEQTGMAAAPEIAEVLIELEAQRQAANQGLEELGAASEETWKEFKPEVEEALDKLEAIYQQVLSQLQESS